MATLQPGQGFALDYAEPNTEYADLLRLAANATTPCIVRVNGACMAGGCGGCGGAWRHTDSVDDGRPEATVLFAQLALEQLAGGGVGQFLDEQNVIR